MRTPFILLLTLLGGCSLTSMTGNMMTQYTGDHMTPYMMGSDDLEMACETGSSMGLVLMSFSRVVPEPHLAAVGVYATAGSCSDEAAWREELRQARALRAGDAAEAMDARIAEKRAHALSARRYYKAYKHMVEGLREPGGKRCPEFGAADERPYTEVSWVLGLVSGLQATVHDRAAGGAVGVPLDLPSKIARGTRCLNNEKWWGVPGALRAAVWASVPGTLPEGEDAGKALVKARALGERAGVRLASAIAAQAAIAAGKREEVELIIKGFAASQKAKPAHEEWRLLDVMAQRQLEAISDRLWTEDKGHRTPFGGFGTFPTTEEPEDEGDDGLLDGMSDEEEAPAAPATTTQPTENDAADASEEAS